jgi:hypothetical protein
VIDSELNAKLDEFINLNKVVPSENGTWVLFQTDYAPAVDTFILKNKEKEPFTVLLNRLREERNILPSDLYRSAWVDRRLYSQIMGERDYQPAKNTAIAFGLALCLPIETFSTLLQSAGFVLNNSSIFDLIIKFCVLNGIYDIATVNDILVSKNQTILR